MSDRERQALMLWDFGHSKKRPKVYVEGRWRNECRCGKVFLTLQGWEDHRIDEGVAAMTSREALLNLAKSWECLGGVDSEGRCSSGLRVEHCPGCSHAAELRKVASASSAAASS